MPISLESLSKLEEQLEIGTDEIYFDEPIGKIMEPILSKFKKPFAVEDKVTAAVRLTNKINPNAPDLKISNPDSEVPKRIFKSAIPPKINTYDYFKKRNNLEDLHSDLRELSMYKNAPSKEMQLAAGKINSKLAIIGYMPSESDISLNIHWSGESGELLKKMLTAIDVELNSCYRTWLVKTPLNRVTPRQLLPLKIAMEKEIELANPDYILIMGEKCAQALFSNGAGLQEIGGKASEFSEKVAVATYDVDFLLKNPGFKRPAWAHLQALQALIV